MYRWLQQTFAALAIAPFRIVWLGTLTSFLAFFMSTVVNSVVAFDLTGANTAVGTVVFAQGAAMMLLGPIGGALADRWPKRAVIAVAQSATAAVFATFAALFATGTLAMWHLAAGSFALGTCFAFIAPARQAIVVDLVPAAQRGNAMALSQVANNASRVGGPAVAGALLAWRLVGAGGAYLVMAALYVVAAASLALLPRSPGRRGASTAVLADVLDGVRYVREEPRLRILLLLFVAVVMAGFPWVAVMPGFVENRLGHGAEAISVLMAVAASGGLVVSVLVARMADAPNARAITSGLGLAFAVSLGALALAPTYAWAVTATFGLGAASGGFQTLATAVLIHSTEPAYVGRVMSLSMLAFAGFGVMGLPIGWLADAVGERGSLAAMAIGVAAIVVGSGVALARVEARHPR